MQPTCADGMLNGDETDVDCGGSCPGCADGLVCEDHPDCASEACDSGVCVPAACGDGITSGVEDCDDVGESAACDGDCSVAECGDATLNVTAGEICDDGGASAACDDDCTTVACGDGNANMAAGEDCDDVGESATCDANCTVAECGDGTRNTTAGEACDAAGESPGCDTDCTLAMCGDGTTNMTRGEDCDDAGESATCDADCTSAMCGDGTLNTSSGEFCDDGGESATCDVDCTPAMCGDSTTNNSAGEDCDDGGESTVCDVDCTTAMCGDGTLNTTSGETCDDGGESAACDSDCTPSACGDGLQNAAAGEQCDDGNNAPGDGCDAMCALEPQTPIDIAAPGGIISPSGSIDITDYRWARPTAVCANEPPTDHYYDVISIVNNTGANQVLAVQGLWAAGDGYLHLYTDPFNPISVANCAFGNNNFVNNGQSELEQVNIAAGQVLHVIASTSVGNTPIGGYTINIFTMTETEPNDDAASADAYTVPFYSSVNFAGDVDYVAVDAVMGQTITAEVFDIGDGSCASLDLDSEVRIFDTDGVTELAFDDDGGVGWCSFDSIIAPATGTYFVRPASSVQFQPNDTFHFEVIVTVN